MHVRSKVWLNRLKLLAMVAIASVALERFAHHDPPPSAAPGALPRLELQTLDGQPLDAHALAGHVAVLNFWATWCPACRSELPDLERFEQKHHDCVKLLGVSGEAPDQIGTFAREHQLTYPMTVSRGALEDQLGIEVIPTSVVLGPDGRIAGRIEGAVTPDELERAIAPLLAHGAC